MYNWADSFPCFQTAWRGNENLHRNACYEIKHTWLCSHASRASTPSDLPAGNVPLLKELQIQHRYLIIDIKVLILSLSHPCTSAISL